MANEVKREVSPSDIRMYEGGFRLSWGSIFAGTFAAITVMLVMSLLGMAFGINPIVTGSISAGAGIWLFISTIVALFAGGWTTGFASGNVRPIGGAIHGFVTWCFFTTATLFLLGSSVVGSLVSGAVSVITRGIAMVEGAAPEAVEGIVEFLPSAGFWGFVALILGGAAAVIGGSLGVSKPSAAVQARRLEEEEEAKRFRRAV